MMPDAEPRVGTTSAAETDPVASEIVDLTDTAQDEPSADRRADAEPDVATDDGPVPLVDVRRRPTGATASGRWAPSCSSRWSCWERRP